MRWLVPAGRGLYGDYFGLQGRSSCSRRTIEWGGSNLNSRYVVVPRGYTQPILLPGGKQGTLFTAQYGYVGFAVEQEIFVAEGMNEAGLSAGLFYFPGYGQYPEYDPQQKSTTVADLQLVPWILGRCRTVEEVEAAVRELRVVSIDPRASTVHWRFADVSGRQVVLEIINGQPRFYENKLGVLTNSPGFDWQMTNLNNYVNLRSGSTTAQWLGHDTELVPFGAGSGFLGIPAMLHLRLVSSAQHFTKFSPTTGFGFTDRPAMFPDFGQFRDSYR